VCVCLQPSPIQLFAIWGFNGFFNSQILLAAVVALLVVVVAAVQFEAFAKTIIFCVRFEFMIIILFCCLYLSLSLVRLRKAQLLLHSFFKNLYLSVSFSFNKLKQKSYALKNVLIREWIKVGMHLFLLFAKSIFEVLINYLNQSYRLTIVTWKF
jgi:hypothetical protein